jgi:Bacteriophage translational regulator
MTLDADILYDWAPEKMVEITLGHPDDFLKIKETLTRIGIASKKQKTLYQSAHILHKKGRYYIISFKEAFLLDGRPSDITLEDVARRNRIITLLEDWKLCSIVNPQSVANQASMSSIKVVPFKEKHEWTLCAKYQLGVKKKQ